MWAALRPQWTELAHVWTGRVASLTIAGIIGGLAAPFLVPGQPSLGFVLGWGACGVWGATGAWLLAPNKGREYFYDAAADKLLCQTLEEQRRGVRQEIEQLGLQRAKLLTSGQESQPVRIALEDDLVAIGDIELPKEPG